VTDEIEPTVAADSTISVEDAEAIEGLTGEVVAAAAAVAATVLVRQMIGFVNQGNRTPATDMYRKVVLVEKVIGDVDPFEGVIGTWIEVV
jgi:hypothetical protein